MNLFSKSSTKTEATKLKQIKDWVYQRLNIDWETPISISQLQCHEPDCPPVETVIAIMTTPPKQYKIHKSISKITEIDIEHHCKVSKV